MAVSALLASLGASAAEDVHSRVGALVRERRFAEAEAIYRQALAASPRDYELRQGLALVMLWTGRYTTADRAFRDLLQERPRHVPTLIAFAQTAYWSGDFRSAQERFRGVLAVDRDNAEAKRALTELQSVSLPRWEVRTTATDDSQPLRRVGAVVRLSRFSDPLTRWDVMIRRDDFRDDVSADISAIAVAGSTSFPSLRLSLDARAEYFSFPDGDHGLVGGVSIGRRIATRSVVLLAAEKTPLLGTKSSLRGHTISTQYRLSWSTNDASRWSASIGAHVVRYSDHNRGEGADAYAIAPLMTGRVGVRAGLSAAWRDTDENRFRFTGFRSQPIAPDLFAYVFSGVYDPYWTPHQLRDGRAVVVLTTSLRSTRMKLQADGGYARDRYLSFTPPSGPTPSPSFTQPLMLDRSFKPWRASLEGVVPLQRGVELRARYRHEVTAFYRANEFEASVGGHF